MFTKKIEIKNAKIIEFVYIVSISGTRRIRITHVNKCEYRRVHKYANK